MEGLCPRRQTAPDDAAGYRVLAPFLPACITEELRQNPVFWLPRESIPCTPSPALPATAGARSPASLHFGNSLPLALPALRGHHGGHPKTHRRGTLAVRLLRFFVTAQSPAANRRAPCTPTYSCVQALPKASPTNLKAPCASRSSDRIDPLLLISSTFSGLVDRSTSVLRVPNWHSIPIASVRRPAASFKSPPKELLTMLEG